VNAVGAIGDRLSRVEGPCWSQLGQAPRLFVVCKGSKYCSELPFISACVSIQFYYKTERSEHVIEDFNTPNRFRARGILCGCL